MLKLIWLEPAVLQLEAALEYIAERSEPAANHLDDEIEACVQRLTEHPYMYCPGRVPGTREAVVHPNYILIYRVTTDAV